jgi:UDP-N-acetylmuramoyl-tripeptide--D-alanyl-D-alanine ligase
MNTASFTQSELISILGTRSNQLPLDCHGISTDSRSIQPGNLYVPLKGEQFDGHAFIEDVMAKGAVGTLIQENSLHIESNLSSIPHLIVDDTLHALGSLAHHHRLKFDIPMIAIAGAAGKTSTKDCAAHVLGTCKHTLKTMANHNNQIGVPLTMLMLNEQHEAAVIEIGTNEPGEIAILASMLSPTHGLITNIGKEHLEKLIDLDGVEKEETALFRWLEQCGGTRLINMNDERLMHHANGPRHLTYALDSNADIHAEWRLNEQGLAELILKTAHASQHVQLSLPGKVGAMTAIAAASIGFACGMSLQQIADALQHYEAPVYTGYGRMSKTHIDDITILNDSYNANPASMMTALETLSAMPCTGRRIAILGDMRELGTSSQEEHRNLLQQVLHFCDECIVTGSEFSEAFEALKNLPDNIIRATDAKQCAQYVNAHAQSGDIILIKGSRGIKLEQVLEHWREFRIQSEHS